MTRALGLHPVGRPAQPPDPRVLALHAQGWSFGEIAKALGHTRGKVGGIIKRANRRAAKPSPRKVITLPLPSRHYRPKDDPQP